MGYPVHPISFRVGKTLPWLFPSHHYRSDRLVNLSLLRGIAAVLRRRLVRALPPTRSGFIPDMPRIRWTGQSVLVILPFFNTVYDVYWREHRRKFRSRRRVLRQPPRRLGRRLRLRRRGRRRFRLSKRLLQRSRRFRILQAHRRYRLLMRRLGYALPVRRSCELRKKIFIAPRKVYTPRPWHKHPPRVQPSRRLAGGLRLRGRNFGRRAETQFFARKFRSRFRRGRSSLGFFRGFFVNWISMLRRELVKQLPVGCPVRVRLVHRDFNTVTARHLALYTIRRVRLNYRLNRIVFPMMAEARRSSAIKGLFFKFKGRLSRKARASLNTRVMRYGKIGFSTLAARVDYSSMAFRTRYGVCTVQVWLSRRQLPPAKTKLNAQVVRRRANARFLHLAQSGSRAARLHRRFNLLTVALQGQKRFVQIRRPSSLLQVQPQSVPVIPERTGLGWGRRRRPGRSLFSRLAGVRRLQKKSAGRPSKITSTSVKIKST